MSELKAKIPLEMLHPDEYSDVQHGILGNSDCLGGVLCNFFPEGLALDGGKVVALAN